MGMGFQFVCDTCNKEYDVSLGEGFLSFQCDFVNILYACPKCGNWENADVDRKEYSSAEFRNEFKKRLKDNVTDYYKEIIDDVGQVDHKKMY